MKKPKYYPYFLLGILTLNVVYGIIIDNVHSVFGWITCLLFLKLTWKDL